jgi:hypothetical protein
LYTSTASGCGSGLHQPDPGEAALADAIEHGKHQSPADAVVLHRRIDGDRADPGDRAALVHEIAADNPAVRLSDHRIEPGIDQQILEELDADFRGGQIPGKIMLARDRFECLETDRAAGRGIAGCTGSQGHVHVFSSIQLLL